MTTVISGLFIGVGLIAAGIALLVFRPRMLQLLNGILSPSVKSPALDRNVTFFIGFFGIAWIIFGAVILTGTIGTLVGV